MIDSESFINNRVAVAKLVATDCDVTVVVMDVTNIAKGEEPSELDKPQRSRDKPPELSLEGWLRLEFHEQKDGVAQAALIYGISIVNYGRSSVTVNGVLFKGLGYQLDPLPDGKGYKFAVIRRCDTSARWWHYHFDVSVELVDI